MPEAQLAYYTFARSVTMLLFFFLVTPKLRTGDNKTPLILGLIGLIISQLLLITIPPGNSWLLLLVTIIEGGSLPTITTLLGKMLVVNVDAEERARSMSLLNVAVLFITSPFSWIAGQLSSLDRRWPFMLTLVILSAAVLLVFRFNQTTKMEPAA